MGAPETAAAARANNRVRSGVTHREPFFEELVDAGSVADVQRLMREELRKATGRDVAVDLTGGDLYSMKELALASVHWARLHRDVPFNRLSLGHIPSDNKNEATLAEAEAGEVKLNIDYLGAGRRPELLTRLVKNREANHLLMGDRFGAVAMFLHELEHLREIHVGEGFLPDLLKRDPHFAKQAALERAASSQPQVPAYTKSAEMFFKEQPALRLVNDRTAAHHVGKYAARNKYELFAESGARVHLLGRGADWVSLEVTRAVGPVDAIIAAAPHLRLAVRELHTRLDKRDGLPAERGSSPLQPFARPAQARSVGPEPPGPTAGGRSGRPPATRAVTSVAGPVTAKGLSSLRRAGPRRAGSSSTRDAAHGGEADRGRSGFTPSDRRPNRESGPLR
ncbi:hypothetical protein [Embleya sp. NPDC001921]